MNPPASRYFCGSACSAGVNISPLSCSRDCYKRELNQFPCVSILPAIFYFFFFRFYIQKDCERMWKLDNPDFLYFEIKYIKKEDHPFQTVLHACTLLCAFFTSPFPFSHTCCNQQNHCHASHRKYLAFAATAICVLPPSWIWQSVNLLVGRSRGRVSRDGNHPRCPIHPECRCASSGAPVLNGGCRFRVVVVRVCGGNHSKPEWIQSGNLAEAACIRSGKLKLPVFSQALFVPPVRT